MKRNECNRCGERKNCTASFVSWIFFVIGLVSTIAIRIVAVLLHVNPGYAKIAWYVGVGGILIFFLYRFKISHHRARMINEKDFIGKLRSTGSLTDDEREALARILCSFLSPKERINFFLIFFFSTIALLFAIYLDFLH